jgi:hypothetical protein
MVSAFSAHKRWSVDPGCTTVKKESRMVTKNEQKQFTLAEAKVIGDKLGINWETFDVKQFRLFGISCG